MTPVGIYDGEPCNNKLLTIVTKLFILDDCGLSAKDESTKNFLELNSASC